MGGTRYRNLLYLISQLGCADDIRHLIAVQKKLWYNAQSELIDGWDTWDADFWQGSPMLGPVVFSSISFFGDGKKEGGRGGGGASNVGSCIGRRVKLSFLGIVNLEFQNAW